MARWGVIPVCGKIFSGKHNKFFSEKIWIFFCEKFWGWAWNVCQVTVEFTAWRNVYPNVKVPMLQYCSFPETKIHKRNFRLKDHHSKECHPYFVIAWLYLCQRFWGKEIILLIQFEISNWYEEKWNYGWK